MIEMKVIHPYNNNDSLICRYAEDENGKRFHVKQIETGSIYSEAVDVYPCRYTYKATDIEITTDVVSN